MNEVDFHDIIVEPATDFYETQYKFEHRQKDILLVVSQGVLIGIIGKKEFFVKNEKLTAGEIANKKYTFLYTDGDIDKQAKIIFNTLGIMYIPVIERNTGKIKKLLRRDFDEAFAVDTVGEMFLASQKKFSQFLSNYDLEKISADAGKNRMGIIVAPWGYSAVPWFALTIALLYRMNGLSPYIIWDDLCVFDEKSTSTQNQAIAEILEQLNGQFEVIRISEIIECELDQSDRNEVKRLAKLIAIHDFQSSVPTEQSKAYQSIVEQSLNKNLSRIKSLFSQYHFSNLIVPGGICYNSGLFYWAARLQNVRVSSYDCGRSVILIGTDNVAAHLMDIPKLLKQHDIFKCVDYRQKICELSRQELALRMQGKDKFFSQHTSRSLKNEEYKYDILIPLNIEWDTAALGKHQYFDFTYQWLVETIQYILDETPATVAVRQHPAESDYYSGIFGERYFNQTFPNNPRCRFFSCYEKVNTYDLLNHAHLILPLTSTIGIEAAMLGKKVLVESNCYYSELEFVNKALSKQDYFNKIKEGLNNNNPISEDMITQAEICYYLSQICNWLFTDFTSHPDDFNKWSTFSLEQLFGNKGVQDMLKAFHEGIPISLLRSELLLNT